MAECEVFCRAAFGSATFGKPEKYTDSVKREPQFSAAPDEIQTLDVPLAICAMMAFGAGRSREKSGLLIIADRFDINASSLGEHSNEQWFRSRACDHGPKSELASVAATDVRLLLSPYLEGS